MRIGVNVRVLLGENMEGIPRYIYETTLQMANEHPEDEFVLFFDRKVQADFGFPPNVKSVIVPWHARHPILWLWWFEVMMPLYLWWYKIDVFYSGDGYLSLRSKIPTLLVIHDIAYLHYPDYVGKTSLGYYRKYVPKYLKRANHIVTVSEFVKKDIITHLNIPTEKISVAYNAVSPPINVDDIKLPATFIKAIDNKPYFLYVGAIQPRKNILKLIEGFLAFNRQSDVKYKLVLAGRFAWDTNEIQKAIESSTDIFHAGMVSESIKYKLIKDAVALTYISVFEGFGIPLLEAMKMGTPVITSNVTSLPEVAGDAAILVDPDDVKDITKALITITSQTGLRDLLAKKGLERYQTFSWEESAQVIYHSLLDMVKSKAK